MLAEGRLLKAEIVSEIVRQYASEPEVIEAEVARLIGTLRMLALSVCSRGPDG